MIYFLQSVDGGPIKIGHTRDVAKRKAVLECRYRTELVLLATKDGQHKREVSIHRQFSHLRIGRTEEFRPAPDLVEFIGNPAVIMTDSEKMKSMDSMKTLTVRLDPEAKRQLHLHAIRDGKMLEEFIREILYREVDMNDLPTRAKQPKKRKRFQLKQLVVLESA